MNIQSNVSPVAHMLLNTVLVAHTIATKTFSDLDFGGDVSTFAETIVPEIEGAEAQGWDEDGNFAIAYTNDGEDYYARIGAKGADLIVTIERHD